MKRYSINANIEQYGNKESVFIYNTDNYDDARKLILNIYNFIHILDDFHSLFDDDEPLGIACTIYDNQEKRIVFDGEGD